MDIPTSIQEKFLAYLDGELSPAEFEKWIYDTPELEAVLGEENYLKILSYDFHQEGGKSSIKAILKQYIDYGKYETQFILKLVEEIKENSSSCQSHLKTVYQLYCSGYNFLDNLGIGYGLKLVVPYEFDADKWEDIEEEKRKAIIDGFYPKLAEEADKVIRWINNEQLKLSGKVDEMGRKEYIDNRTEAEKKATAYRRNDQ